MHGLNPFRPTNLKARTQLEVKGLRSLLGRPTATELFSAAGLINLPDAEARLQTLMRRLSARVVRGHNSIWMDKLGPTDTGLVAGETWENPYLPSGYTYFMQLIAHDLVASAVSQSLNRAAQGTVENTRSKPLCLDTIYGGGPEVSPHAYEFSTAHRNSNGLVPRTHLRVGPPRTTFGGAPRCPFRDIGRAMATDAVDSGRDNSFRRDWLTEALVVDPRNDSHALLSQLTVLFHILHNHIMDILEARPLRSPAWTPAEVAFRRFLCARHGVTAIYRNIIVKDVLKRILHPDIHAAASKFPLHSEEGIPKEFSHGAFRFGHAMIRDQYLVNSTRFQDIVRGLNQSSTRTPGMVPVKAQWLVDWSRFFEIDTIVPNLSRRIGPDFALSIQTEDAFPSIGENDGFGLAFRDYMSGAFAGLRSVADLQRKFAILVPPLSIWEAPLRAWLNEIPGTMELSEPFEPADIDRIVADPPLPFFVQFEAAHSLDDGGKPVRKDGGRHLGHLGSAIVAETIFGAMGLHQLGFEADGPGPTGQIAACCEALLDDRQALTDVGVAASGGSTAHEIASMPDLIGFLETSRAFPDARPR